MCFSYKSKHKKKKKLIGLIQILSIKRFILKILWILFTLSSFPGLFKFDILFLNILFVLIAIIPYSRLTGLDNIYIYIYIYI